MSASPHHTMLPLLPSVLDLQPLQFPRLRPKLKMCVSVSIGVSQSSYLYVAETSQL
jgi:hypothetical protein